LTAAPLTGLIAEKEGLGFRELEEKMRDGAWPKADREWVRGLPEQLGLRKLRLLAGAWCRRLLEAELEKVRSKSSSLAHLERWTESALEASDRYADTGKTKAALKQEVIQLESLRNTHASLFGPPVLLVLTALVSQDPLRTLDACAISLTLSRRVPRDELMPELRRMAADMSAPEGADPNPACESPAVLDLAQTIYRQREFGRMGELAEALEAAGSRNAHALSHCRAADANHIRGCWVLDGILGQRIAKPQAPKPPRGTLKRHQVLGRELYETRDSTLSLLAGAEARGREFTARGKPHQQFARVLQVEDAVLHGVLEHLGFGPIEELGPRLHRGADCAVEYFLGDWWQGDEADSKALDKSRPDRELAWFGALPNGLLLCGLTGRWDDAARICAWFDTSIQMEYRFELNDYEYQWIYLCIVSHLRSEPLEGLDVEGTLQALRECRPKRPRLLGTLWEAVLQRDQAAFNRALRESLRHFLKTPETAPNPNFWVARDESLMWLIAEKEGLGFPDLEEKMEAVVVRRETVGTG
jgi:hypothetical protein